MASGLKRIIGAQVRAARARKGLTQEQLAAAVERTAEGVSNIERGQALPTIETLARISQALGVPLQDFFAEAEAPSGRSATRFALEMKARELIRELRDEDLKLAVGQIEIIRHSRSGGAKRA